MTRPRHIAGAWLVAALVAGMPAHAESPVARGDYLVNGILACGNCHSPRRADGTLDPTRRLSGGPLVWDEPAFRVQAPNLTPDRETGLGAWSDAQIKAALQEGVRRDGTRLAPTMPSAFYRILTPADLDAIVAYLRALPPVRNTVAPPEYRKLLPEIAVPGAGKPATPAALRDPVKRGFYLVTIGHCMLCHTPKDDQSLGGQGGHAFEGPWGVSVSRNITQHRDNGIGAWSDDAIRAAITAGRRPDGSALKPPMAYDHYARMTREDLDAVVAYLRTVPPRD